MAATIRNMERSGASLATIIDILLLAWLRLGRYRWSRLRRMLEWRHARTALPAIASLDDLEPALGQVTWTLDGPLHLYDAISRPETTWALKRDDCDGFATLAAALLRAWDPATQPTLLTVMVRPVKASHTVCVFKTSDGVRMTDNARLRPEFFASYAEAAAAVGQRGHRTICWDIVDPVSLRVLEYHGAST